MVPRCQTPPLRIGASSLIYPSLSCQLSHTRLCLNGRSGVDSGGGDGYGSGDCEVDKVDDGDDEDIGHPK